MKKREEMMKRMTEGERKGHKSLWMNNIMQERE
jgi:hypothetical protein